MSTEKTELLNCPFCGGDATLVENAHLIGDFCVYCSKCGARSKYIIYELGASSIKKAIAAWNTRI